MEGKIGGEAEGRHFGVSGRAEPPSDGFGTRLAPFWPHPGPAQGFTRRSPRAHLTQASPLDHPWDHPGTTQTNLAHLDPSETPPGAHPSRHPGSPRVPPGAHPGLHPRPVAPSPRKPLSRCDPRGPKNPRLPRPCHPPAGARGDIPRGAARRGGGPAPHPRMALGPFGGSHLHASEAQATGVAILQKRRLIQAVELEVVRPLGVAAQERQHVLDMPAQACARRETQGAAAQAFQGGDGLAYGNKTPLFRLNAEDASLDLAFQDFTHAGFQKGELYIEVLVVLDSCSDATGAIARACGARTLAVDACNVGRARAAGADGLLAAVALLLEEHSIA